MAVYAPRRGASEELTMSPGPWTCSSQGSEKLVCCCLNDPVAGILLQRAGPEQGRPGDLGLTAWKPGAL